jgi:putative effector of murein hydrolase
VIEAEEQSFIEKLISHATVKTLAEPIYMGLPGAMKYWAMLYCSAQASTTSGVSSVPLSAQHPNNLLFRKSGSLHLSVLHKAGL